ncbi:hypothetical protein WN943_014382 [Citrus x changshan-huyou]
MLNKQFILAEKACSSLTNLHQQHPSVPEGKNVQQPVRVKSKAGLWLMAIVSPTEGQELPYSLHWQLRRSILVATKHWSLQR